MPFIHADRGCEMGRGKREGELGAEQREEGGGERKEKDGERETVTLTRMTLGGHVAAYVALNCQISSLNNVN